MKKIDEVLQLIWNNANIETKIHIRALQREINQLINQNETKTKPNQ